MPEEPMPPAGVTIPAGPISGLFDPRPFRERFEAEGFVGPVPILDAAGAARLAGRLRKAPRPEWQKGYAASCRDHYAAATHPAILDRVSAVLGGDVMLWGARLIVRRPGQVHPWHTDIETAGSPGRTVSVWLGLERVNRRSSLQVIPGSHRFGISVQEARQREGAAAAGVTAERALAWARKHDPRSEVVGQDMGNGDALFFDGRLWHGTDNTNPRGVRTALLLQYASPDRPVRIPDYGHLEWPFRFHEEPRPPCIMVRGTDVHGRNRLVPPPSSPPAGSSWAHALELPLAGNPETGWQAHSIHVGATAALSRLTCHASVLDPGTTPHPPHHHPEEEVLVVLDGEATLLIGPSGAGVAERVGRGAFAYYPSGQPHTLTNESDGPVTYLMFKWRGRGPGPGGERLEAAVQRPGDPPPAGGREKPGGRTVANLLEGPTDFLRKFHVHRSTIRPGGGYAPHVDAYDVALLVLDGTVETLGRRVGPNGVVFYAAGDPHGIRNVGEGDAVYLVFEFHGGSEGSPDAGSRRGILAQARAAVRRVLPRRVRRALRRGVDALGRRGPGVRPPWPDGGRPRSSARAPRKLPPP